VPTLKLTIEQSERCTISFVSVDANVPVAGRSLPITVTSDCLYAQQLRFRASTNNLFVDIKPAVLVVGAQVVQYQHSYNSHNFKDASALGEFVLVSRGGAEGDIVEVSMHVEGAIEDSYVTNGERLTYTLVKNIASIKPNATAKVTDTTDGKSIEFTCTKPGILHWSIIETGSQYNPKLEQFKLSSDATYPIEKILEKQALNQRYLNDFVRYLSLYKSQSGPAFQGQMGDYGRQVLYGDLFDRSQNAINRKQVATDKIMKARHIAEVNDLAHRFLGTVHREIFLH
jgi:hypothetical protein